MGTRNLTAVFIDGEYKIAQYGQWDGYPEGQGITCLEFLRDKMDEERFKSALRELDWINKEELNKMWIDAGAEDGMISIEKAKAFEKKHPEFSRDTGAGILELVQNGSVGKKMQNEIAFVADGLFCEWAWVIDFDKRTFEAYRGFSHKPTTKDDRFYFLCKHEADGYTAVKIVKYWSIDNLPTNENFLKEFEEEQ